MNLCDRECIDPEQQMHSRLKVARELAELCKIAAHPDRIRIIEHLHNGQFDVKTLSERLGIPSARISQHLSMLRAHRHVQEDRQGRHHIYSLTQPKLAEWILGGLEFLEHRPSTLSTSDIQSARDYWAQKNNETGTS